MFVRPHQISSSALEQSPARDQRVLLLPEESATRINKNEDVLVHVLHFELHKNWCFNGEFYGQNQTF